MSRSNSRLLVVNDQPRGHDRPFRYLGLEYTTDTSLLQSDPDSIGLVVFTGGADVSPQLYNARPHPLTYSNIGRDTQEVAVFHDAYAHGIPLAGICRGAQLLCMMAGGRLLQDVSNHRMCTHPVIARHPGGYTTEIEVSGDHHQMQYPWDLPKNEFEVLAWSPRPLSQHYAFDDERVVDIDAATPMLRMEPDVVWYPQIKALAMQFHPEWMDESTPAVKYARALVDHYLISEESSERAAQ